MAGASVALRGAALCQRQRALNGRAYFSSDARLRSASTAVSARPASPARSRASPLFLWLPGGRDARRTFQLGPARGEARHATLYKLAEVLAAVRHVLAGRVREFVPRGAEQLADLCGHFSRFLRSGDHCQRGHLQRNQRVLTSWSAINSASTSRRSCVAKAVATADRRQFSGLQAVSSRDLVHAAAARGATYATIGAVKTVTRCILPPGLYWSRR
jgi:hypothetical protein